MIPIIGITGNATSGKDTIANFLVEDFGYTRVGLADPLKEIARELGWDGSKEVSPPCYCCGMLRGRQFLQVLGTEAIRKHIYDSVWVDVLFKNMGDRSKNYVVPDVRFVNEAEAIQDVGGTIWRVIRPGFGIGKVHLSESEMDSIYADEVIENDGTLSDLRIRVRELVTPDYET